MRIRLAGPALLLALLAACASSSPTTLTAYNHGDPQVRELWTAGKTKAALDLAQRRVRERPDDPRAHFTLGTVLLLSPDASTAAEADKAFRRASELRPNHAPTVHNGAVAAMRAGDLARAASLCADATRLAPELALPWRTRARIALLRGRPREAIRWAEHAADLAPYDRDTQLQLVAAYLRNNDVRRAHDTLDRLAGADDAPGIAVGRSVAYRLEGRFRKALRYAREAAARAPERSDTQLALVLALERTASEQETLAAYQHALDAHPRDPDLLYNYASFLRERGQMAQAVPWYQRYLDVAPASTGATFDVRRWLNSNGRPVQRPQEHK